MKEFVKKKAVIVMDSAGLPNYMTMFYMEPGTYEPEDVPELFKIRNKIVPAVLVSQFTNTMIKGVPASLPYQQPNWTKCRKLRTSWELYRMTGSMKQLDFGQTANLKKACLSGVRVSATLPTVVLVRCTCTTPVLASTTLCPCVPLCSWKTGNW